ncbi:MAG: hypothetical protein CO060_00515 [Candidatus Yonathbacteria bacterium CG_4_9_14_0_2_um_filter_43_16]|uniref:Baseplate protein J-like domain-containing protein n=1 Tax=Candidatus Yonathbacteria bacterium CG_4_10_14_0_8_um_filter_43_17 TaxID=1975099 RepID=A0A2M7Q4L7_9BACT|nr:MAG: hypothetical protein COW60_02115 [Candidatus Yonathbacteria bacterium CG17_big_fil_post_rev_8_21_14_2_50_43_9]PIX57233.1 MAG: hypothetical protein COZ48_01725 [Candidatus Yonathbacteria bacterium CG_4_10_14_3_um_filter_43_12]PIY58371.1 MAG: hypothetical protein COY98_03050 [Candidatus Yonathbacteria bacterium CG_4_10_14_0_8_um_filter_43_17]PJC22340.1 MAG: hypothetical protein CO060_00515 [Candidatus Yonathbacteria bacterium CG_4_9_14_0_2_um_filter_43_16]
MNDIIRKKMNDVIVPAAKPRISLFEDDVIRRPVIVPETHIDITPTIDDEADRIESNPFFKKYKNDTVKDRPKGSGLRGILWSLLFALFLASGFVVLNYFASATIEMVPVTRNITLNKNLVALNNSESGELVFHIVPLNEKKSKDVSATIEKKIQVKASGKVMIYNSYSSVAQRLIPNTRFEDEKTHKIYRINTPIVVPGTMIVNGETVPGSIEATVYADAAGEEYNIGLVDKFTIPGFKGDPRYSKFYAVSKPELPIDHGFSGTVKVPSDEAIKSAQEELKEDLKKIAVEKARAQIPVDATFFPGSMVFRFEEVPNDPTAIDTPSVSMRAIVYVFFFDTVSLTEKLAFATLPDDNNNPFIISNMSSLEFRLNDEDKNIVPSDLSRIRFEITGTAEFVGQIDTKSVQNALAGKSKKDFEEIIKKQGNIKDVNMVLRPMWKTTFPVDPTKITIKIVTK